MVVTPIRRAAVGRAAASCPAIGCPAIRRASAMSAAGAVAVSIARMLVANRFVAAPAANAAMIAAEMVNRLGQEVVIAGETADATAGASKIAGRAQGVRQMREVEADAVVMGEMQRVVIEPPARARCVGEAFMAGAKTRQNLPAAIVPAVAIFIARHRLFRCLRGEQSSEHCGAC